MCLASTVCNVPSTVGNVGEKVFIDLLSMSETVRKNRFLLTVKDGFTRFASAYPMRHLAIHQLEFTNSKISQASMSTRTQAQQLSMPNQWSPSHRLQCQQGHKHINYQCQTNGHDLIGFNVNRDKRA